MTRGGTASRAVVPLCGFVAAVVVVEAMLSPVGFGVSGAPLLLLASAVTYPAAAVVFFAARRDSAARVSALTAMAASAVGLHVADPTGPVIGLFLVAAMAPLAERVTAATAVLVTAVVVYNAVQVGLGGESLIITIATDAGCAFFYLFGTLLRTERAQREAVSRLLQQLEASRAAERETSRAAERAALAREIHDVLAHSMSGLVIQLSGARLLAESAAAPPQLLEALEKAHDLARSGLDDTRRAVRMLRDGPLPGLDGIDRLLVEHAELTGIPARWRETGDRVPVPAQVELALYRWAQETLSNVRKHAMSTVAHLELHWAADDVTAEAWNGLDGGATGMSPGSGFGLQGMAERATALGGGVEVEHTADHFRTVMRIPHQPA